MISRLRELARRAAGPAAGLAIGCALGALLVARCRPSPPAREERASQVAAVASHSAELVQAVDVHRTTERETTRTDSRPDGRRVVTVTRETSRADEAGRSSSSATGSSSVEARERTVIVRERPGWRLGAAAGWELARPTLRPVVYGADLSRRVAGPLWLGAWARTDGAAGLSLAVEW